MKWLRKHKPDPDCLFWAAMVPPLTAAFYLMGIFGR